MQCKNCNKEILVRNTEHLKSKSGYNFCSQSCSAIYNNTHKETGYRRSKLEAWIESQLNKTYPDLEILCNKKEAIGAELDFYLPSLKLAFEFNGIFHYKPIYGLKKFESTKRNDINKIDSCLSKGIRLIIIDISKQKHFKPETSKEFLDIVTNAINSIKLEIT